MVIYHIAVVFLLVLIVGSHAISAEPAVPASQKTVIKECPKVSNTDDAIDVLYAENCSPEERKAALKVLSVALTMRYESYWIIAIEREVRKDKHALDHVLPEYGKVIKAWKDRDLACERMLCDLLDILLVVERVPKELIQELETVAGREEENPFAASRAAAIILMSQPDREDLWNWFNERLAGDERLKKVLAAYSLGRIGKVAKPMVPALTELLQDKDVAVRVGAASALWKIQPEGADLLPIAQKSLLLPPAFVPLRPISVSESGNPDHRHHAVTLLARMGPVAHSAAQDIANMLPKEDLLLRIYAVAALEKIGNRSPEVLEALRRTSQDSNVHLAHMAKVALKELTARQSD